MTGKLPILDLGPQYRSIESEVHTAITRVLESGSFIMGPDVAEFEKEAADFLGARHAIGLNSGTDALFLALRALGIGPGDEVITTPFTFFATAEAISHVGATPVFVDIDEASFNIDPAAVDAAITPRTRAVIPVHLYGRPVDMTALMAVASAAGIAVVEDCAQSFGARYQGRQTGTIGAVGTFSFFPSKNLGAYGDAGMLTTDDDAVAEQVRMLRVHGARKKYFNEVVGYNSRLDTLQAAILRVKLPHVEEWNAGRRRVAARYGELLAAVPGVVAPAVSDGHVFHQYTIRVLDGRRAAVEGVLTEAGIATMLYYPVPVHHLPLYRDAAPTLPIAERLSNEVLSLPIWPELDDADIVRVVDVVAGALRS